MAEQLQLPVKTREIHNHHMDSTIWNEFAFRDGDVIVGTWAKAGTTWVQQIVGQLILGPDPDLHVTDLAPWLDLRVLPREMKLSLLEAQTHRRFIKTHLPVDALTFSPKAKYIYVGRDARDVVWSLYHHHHSFTADAYRVFNETPGLVGPPLERPIDDIRQYWHDWLEGDGYPFWSFWENIATWWAIRDLPNVMLVHFNELKADMDGRMRDIAEFLGVEVDQADWPQIHEYCSFEWMKEHADRTAPGAGMLFEGGGKSFINKGVNGRWQEVLSAEESARYEAIAAEKLGRECAAWLAHGS
ncbi:MAG: sulfotransferase [Proteobacteria bacterium]|nr:sulfotransferase [Pseudomonadota bacterium]